MSRPRIPIINLYGNLVVPIQGAIGDDAMAELSEAVTRCVEKQGARGLVIDVSGVDVMDSYMTRNLRDLALTARLMGVHTVVSGLQPAIAIALVQMGLEISGIQTTLSLERAIEYLASVEEGEMLDGSDAGTEPDEGAANVDERG